MSDPESAPEIRIIKPFEDGFPIMKSILFQPFDFTKWLVLGFAAFLGGHFTAGGFSPPLNFPNGFADHRSNGSGWDFAHQGALFNGIFAAIIVVVLLLVIVFTWVRARGIFVFTDCIVRRRAAIAEPWREYRREGNSLFLFYLGVMGAIFLVIALVVGTGVLLFWLAHLPRNLEIAAIITVAVIGFAAYVAFVVTVTLLGYFMPMVMYRRRCRALDALKEVSRLMFNDPGAFVLFALFGILLFLGWMTAACIVTCATCCMASLPYVGTVLLLPVFIWLRSFGMLFLRQFGPEYDVWAGAAPVPPPLPPPAPISG